MITKRADPFDVPAALARAWDVLWKDNMRRREAGRDFRGDTYHLTASDLENQVRAFAEDALAGRPWRAERAYAGYGFMVRFRGDLQNACRRWLRAGVAAGRLESHNFGRGHVSGERFRPRGEPLSAAEARTIEKEAARRANPRPRPRHYSQSGYGARPLCSIDRAKRKNQRFWRSSKAWTTRKREDVTCGRCLWLLASEPAPACEAC